MDTVKFEIAELENDDYKFILQTFINGQLAGQVFTNTYDECNDSLEIGLEVYQQKGYLIEVIDRVLGVNDLMEKAIEEQEEKKEKKIPKTYRLDRTTVKRIDILINELGVNTGIDWTATSVVEHAVFRLCRELAIDIDYN